MVKELNTTDKDTILAKMCEIVRKKEEVKNVINAVSKVYCIEVESLLYPVRFAFLMDARRQTILFLRKYVGLTWAECGMALNRDHATAINLYKRAEDLFEYDKEFKSFYNDIARELGLADC